MQQTLLAVLCLLLFDLPSFGEERRILLDDFSGSLSDNWQVKSFHGLTHYTPTKVDDQTCLAAESDASASGLVYELKLSPEAYPILEWSWYIKDVIPGGNAHQKEGDDYPARVYLVFPHFLFWKTKAINYIWANSLPQGTFLPNAYTANAVMVALQSGPERAGQWVHERRNIYQDYRTAFGESPPSLGAIALMTDTDDTGQQAFACYGPISISPDGQPAAP